MHRRLYYVSCALLLALGASTASAQFIKTKKIHDANVRQASCAGVVEGCQGDCGGSCGALPVAAAGCAGGSCGPSVGGNVGPCGAGGCGAGGCSTDCVSAPYGFCLYQNDCYGGCGSHCKTIFHEMALSLRRRALGRKSCAGNCGDVCGGGCSGGGLLGGSLFRGGLGGCTGGVFGRSMLEASCGCEDVGCTGGCMGGCVGGGGILQGGVLGGRLLEASCGCESAGCLGECSQSLLGEASCGCEDVGCTGDCGLIAIGDGCTGSAPAPCSARGGLLSGIGGLLFGKKCGCNACTMVGDLGCEASCGCEDAGCMGGCGVMPSGCATSSSIPNSSIRQPRGQVVSPEQAYKSRLLTRKLVRKPRRTSTAAKRATPRDVNFAVGESKTVVEQVGFEEGIQQPIRFMKSDTK